MRLQKYLAECGVASRRHAEEMIRDRRVTVNGTTVTEMGTQVEEGDRVTVDGRAVRPEKTKRYIMYHKPAGEVTTASDPEGRKTVLSHFEHMRERLYPVGRLDYDSEGLLLLTNDGDLTNRLLHPRNEVDKTYVARVGGELTIEQVKTLRGGVVLDERRTSPARVQVTKREEDYTYVTVTIHEGRNRQVRRMFEAVGLEVLALKRVGFGPLTLGDLKRGQWRDLTPEEIAKLKALDV
ncbi:MAG: rRNA pseudouridine synthase [Clostridia bacterium]|nr:rRNA pseudouridine synthase [Clostridia bacterium]